MPEESASIIAKDLLKEIDYQEARAVARLIDKTRTDYLRRVISTEIAINISCIYSTEAFQYFLYQFRQELSDKKTPLIPSPLRNKTEEIEQPFSIPRTRQIYKETSPRQN
jgi:hypothetical protein